MVPRKLMVMMLMMRMEVDDAADTKMLLLLLLFILLTMMVMMLQKLTMMVLMLMLMMMMMTMMMMMLMMMKMMMMMMMMMDVMMMNVLLGKWRVEETCMQADSLQLQVLARAHPSAEMNLGAPLPPLGARVLCDDRLMIVYSVRLDGCVQVSRSNLGCISLALCDADHPSAPPYELRYKHILGERLCFGLRWLDHCDVGCHLYRCCLLLAVLIMSTLRIYIYMSDFSVRTRNCIDVVLMRRSSI